MNSAYRAIAAAVIGISMARSQDASAGLRQLLSKTAQAYATTVYDVSIESATTQRLLSGGAGRPGEASPVADPPMKPNLIHMIRSGRAMRFEIQNANTGRKHFYVSDGSTTWHYADKGHDYSERAADEWTVPPNSSLGLPYWDQRYFSKFRVIEEALHQARLIGTDNTCEGNETAHVQIQLSGDKADSLTEDLWIHTGTGRVCRLEAKRISTTRGQVVEMRTTTTWKYQDPPGTMDPALFTFKPDSKWKRVKELPHPM